MAAVMKYLLMGQLMGLQTSETRFKKKLGLIV